jgi:8-oxo-dGTP pyrophosphatase MutT (NUDIX family)
MFALGSSLVLRFRAGHVAQITSLGCSYSGLSVVPAIVSCMGELVERVDELDLVLGVVDRAEAERRRWVHRIATTICRDPMRRILVLRRAEQHTRFPGHYDVMVGGAVDVGESYEDAAARELSEELGVSVPVRFMFKFLYRDGVSPVWFGVHEAVIAEPLVPDPSEIAWHAWLTELELREVVDRWPFVPGGREAVRRYKEITQEEERVALER